MHILKLCPKLLKDFIYKFIYFIFKLLRPKHFFFNGKKIQYENSFYNTSFFNERTVEIPMIKEIISSYKRNNFLEIGNVLQHYNYPESRVIVDKYEVSQNVINEDIETYSTQTKFNLIVSISTLEHVGLDEGEMLPDKDKLQRCILNISNNLLAKEGVLIVTLPVNYNENVDKFIRENTIFQEKFFMKKDSLLLNTWKKVSFDDLTVKNRSKPILIEDVFFGIYRKN
jgi:hypothetical protein